MRREARMITAIVAYDKNRLIGLNGKLPWKIKDEMRHFRDTTMGGIVIMGHKTYESIGHALEGRINLIISRKPKKYTLLSEEWFTSIEDAIEYAELYDEETYIIGGEQIYKQALELDIVNYILASEIKREIKVCQNDVPAYFPKISWPRSVIAEYKDFDIVEYIRA